ncbi:hypothetical protein [Duncaniella freteri]|uniref:hypothetical protein n=1 Tax=Duncaniella freteri TaxID=2530391 RepID=UPI0025780564|nr:hypothetical protein [Duncaniella freteri]
MTSKNKTGEQENFGPQDQRAIVTFKIKTGEQEDFLRCRRAGRAPADCDKYRKKVLLFSCL